MTDNVWAFRTAFASYLRRYPRSWRLRRRDYLAPVDFHLAKRQITLQGQVSRALFRAFQDEVGIAESRGLAEGGEARVFLPFAVFPKRVLLDFSTFDASNNRVPLLTREEDCRVSATHLLGLWPAGSLGEPDDASARGAYLVMRTLCSVDPAALGRRIEAWHQSTLLGRPGHVERAWRPTRQRTTGVEALALSDLVSEWVRAELTAFNPGLAAHASQLPQVLKNCVDETPALIMLDYLDFDERLDRHRLMPFHSLAELVVFAVREAARIIAFDLIRADNRFETPRNAFIASELEELVPAGLRAVSDMLSSVPLGVPRMAMKRELARASIGWMAHLVAPLRLDEPFHYRVSEVIPFRRESFVQRQKLRLWTYQTYRVTPTDAQSNHVEIATEDPELVLDFKGGVAATARGVDRPEELFGEEYSESLAVAHFYNAALSTEAPFRGANSVAIYARYKLPVAVKAGYFVTTISLGGVAAWSAYERLRAEPGAGVSSEALVAAAAFVVVLVFLMNVQHRPIVHGKLEFARWAFYASVALVILVPFVAWLVDR
jgi:hypothetical protein